MYDNAHGGNDTLIGGDGAILNFFRRHLRHVRSSRGGNDTLIGGATRSRAVGDATSCTATPAAAMTR